MPTEGAQDQDLPRRLGAFDAATIVVGSMIGSGIFLKASSIARAVPDPRLALAVWAISGALTFFGALSLAELGAMMPRSGGLYAALHEAYGPFVAYLFGWSLLAILQSGSIAGLAAAVVERALSAQLGLSDAQSILCAGALVVLFSGLSLISVRGAAGVQNALTVAKSGAILLMIFGAFALGHGSLANLAPAGRPQAGQSWPSAFGLAMIGSLWAYDGWINLSFVAGEVRQAQKNVPRALLYGTLFVVAVYLLTNFAYHFVLAVPEVQAAANPARALALRIAGEYGAALVAAAVAVSALGTLNSSVLTGTRVYFAMAKDGLFPHAVARVHPRFSTPHVSILVQCVWSLALLGLWKTFDALTDNVVFVFWIFYGLGAGAVLLLRRRAPDAPRPFRTPGYPFVPLAFIAGALYLTGNTLYDSIAHEKPAVLEALGLLAAGAVFYPLFRRRAPLLSGKPANK